MANAKPIVKPIMIVNVSKNLDDHPLIGLDNYRTFYRYRWCKECQEVKPPRAHHCSLCQSCVMKMDHHCPWVGNCVGLLNHKFFWLFLFYVDIGLLLIGSMLFESGIGRKVYNGTMVGAFAVSASVTILLVMHTFFILNNWSTIEYAALSKHNIFKNHSYGRSWRLHFGENCWQWFLPIWEPSFMNGLDYEADVTIPNIEVQNDFNSDFNMFSIQ